jgi:hypothetical protein
MTRTRTLSIPSVRKLLKMAGFDLEAIVEQNRGQIEIGYLNMEEGRVDPDDYTRTEQAATVAGELLGWGGYRTGYGTYILKKDYRYNPLVAANID